MKLLDAIKNFKWGYLLISTLLMCAGVLVIIFPTESMKSASYIIAVCAILCGIFQLVKLLADSKRGFSFAISVIISSLTLICGLTALIIPEQIMRVYPMFIGLLIIIDGSFKLQTVINAKKFKLRLWWVLLFVAVITIALGFITVRVRVGEIDFKLFSLFLGSAVLLCGVENFISLFYLGKIAKLEMADESCQGNE